MKYKLKREMVTHAIVIKIYRVENDYGDVKPYDLVRIYIGGNFFRQYFMKGKSTPIVLPPSKGEAS